MKKKFIIGGIAVVVIAVVILWLTVFGKSGNGQSAYKIDSITRGDIEALVVASGSLNPVDVVDVSTQVSGRLVKVLVDFNSKVKSGQVVAEIDQSSFLTRLDQNQANYRSAQAALDGARVTMESTKKKFERAQSLFEKNLISFEEKENSETQYLSSEADLKSSEARLEQARSQLDSSKVDLSYTVIRSPIDGIVISRNVNVGQTVAASFQAPILFQIANDLSKMRVECSIDEADIGKVQEGQEARFSVDAFPNDNFVGKVSQVRYSATVQQNVVTYTAIVDVNNPDLKLRPGMTATASILTGQARNALRVPNAALRFQPDLTAEQLTAILKKARDEMMAKRQASGQGSSGGDKPRSEGSSGAQAGSGGGTMIISGSNAAGGTLSPEMIARLRQSGRQRQTARVWVEEKGQLRPIFLRTGVTDNSFTEIKWGDLKEGQQVITGNSLSAQRDSSRPPGGMMFLRR
ncbi:MAG: efflux RND transporter periplasmic adaptor subunit [Candidatus Aminicenantales bacterium]